jgi:hypothetical protein
MGMVATLARPRWAPALVALVAGLALGGLFSYYGISKDGTDTFVTRPPLDFQSPDVTDLPVARAIDRLVAAGYRVVAVGHGPVQLQERGFRGNVLRIQGRDGTRLRYCSARLPDCVPIRP